MQLYSGRVLRMALIGVIAAGSFTSVSAQDNAALPFDPGAIKGTFANGLTYYVRPNHKPEHKVELRMVVKAGSILEDDDQQGLAHFMEHMNFNGTTNFQKNALVSYLQSIGVQFGADLNAYTSFDQTVYILPIPTDKEGNLEKGFQIIEDWAHNALLTDSDIDGERGVVLEESRLRKGAGLRMRDKYFPRLVSGSKYAERLPIGKDNILKSFKYSTIRNFYHDWYRPDLQAVAVVGDIDTATAMKYIRQHFEGLKNPKKEKPREYISIAPRTKPDAMVVTDIEATTALLQVLYPYNKRNYSFTKEDYKHDLERNLVLTMINTRLSDLAQGTNPPFVFSQVYFDDLVQGYESFGAVAVLGKMEASKALDAVAAELLRAKQYGFTASEFDIAKKDMMSGMEKQYKERTTTDSKAYVEEFVRNFLDKEPVPGLQNEYGYYKEMLPSIQLSNLNKLPAKWMPNQNTFTLITAPDKEKAALPDDGMLLSMSAKAFQQSVKPIEEKTIASSLMNAKPVPGMVLSHKDEPDFAATTYTLSNGIKVTIKSTDFKSDEIQVKGIKKGGTNSYGVADKSNANYATSVVSAMGVASFTPSDMEKVTAGKNISFRSTMTDINDMVFGSSTVKDFETFLQLMYLNMEQPRKDEALFNAFKEKQKSQVMFISANPQAAITDTMYKTLYNNNPLARTIIPKPEDFDKINLDRSLQIYKNEFGNADGYHFFIVGNVDPKTALPLLETYLGSIPAANKTAAFKDNGVRPINGVHTLDLKKGKEKQSIIISNYYGEVNYSEDLDLRARALAEVLNIKVIEDLREKMGGIYTGGFRASVTKEPYARYSISLNLPCGPENVTKLLNAAGDEIKMLKQNGPDAKDLDKVKSQWREKYLTSVKENGYWTGKMEDVLFWGKDKDHVFQYEAWINKLTPQDIQQTANQLFNGKNQMTSVLYPEAGGAPTDRSSN
ncbi:MAG: insulinase family protein [Taibaiella sp.]|nr:insulinase family protein [Taibaiella sp.]